MDSGWDGRNHKTHELISQKEQVLQQRRRPSDGTVIPRGSLSPTTSTFPRVLFHLPSDPKTRASGTKVRQRKRHRSHARNTLARNISRRRLAVAISSLALFIFKQSLHLPNQHGELISLHANWSGRLQCRSLLCANGNFSFSGAEPLPLCMR